MRESGLEGPTFGRTGAERKGTRGTMGAMSRLARPIAPLALAASSTAALLGGCDQSPSSRRPTVDAGAVAAPLAAQAVPADATTDGETFGHVGETPDAESDAPSDEVMMACEANAKLSRARAHDVVDCINHRFSDEAAASWKAPNTVVLRIEHPGYREVETFNAVIDACASNLDAGLGGLCRSISRSVWHQSRRPESVTCRRPLKGPPGPVERCVWLMPPRISPARGCSKADVDHGRRGRLVSARLAARSCRRFSGSSERRANHIRKSLSGTGGHQCAPRSRARCPWIDK